MNVRYLLCVCLFLTIRGISFSQTENKSNLTLAADLVDNSLIPLENELTVLGKDKFYNFIIESSNSSKQLFITDIIKRNLTGYKILINADTAGFSDTVDYVILINNPAVDIKYISVYTDNLLGTKKVKRLVTLSYELTITDKKSSEKIYSKSISRKSEDSFNLDEHHQMEDKRFDFSQSVLPEDDSLNRFIFPAIIIAASAVAIILFFSIRSK